MDSNKDNFLNVGNAPYVAELYFKFIEENNKMKLQFLSSDKKVELEGLKE